MLAVVAGELLARQRPDELRRPEDRPAVRGRAVRLLGEPPGQEPVGVVLGQAHLVEHDEPLAVELGLVEARVDRDVGEERDARRRLARGQQQVEVGEVVGGEGVVLTPDALHHPVDGAGRTRRRPLEEHVLEVVREAELRRGFVAAAGAYP